MTNDQVVSAFLAGNNGRGNNLSTDGRLLFSYSMLIAVREQNKVKVVDRKDCPSVTTSKHANMVEREASQLHMDPERIEHSQLIMFV